MKSRKDAPKLAVKSPTSTSRNQDPSNGPSLKEIRLRAYEIYVERGWTDGEDLGDWFQAEKELTEGLRKRTSD
jgi:DUF2934 family protein